MTAAGVPPRAVLPPAGRAPTEDRRRAPPTGSRPTIAIEVVLALPHRQQVIALDVPEGCTAREAVHRAVAAGLDATDAPEVDLEDGAVGIFGERVDGTRVLVVGERVELYRPLRQDPRERRRRRAAETARKG